MRDRILELFFLRAGLATAVGFILEFMFVIFASVMFPDFKFVQDILKHETTTEVVISLVVFHLIGWVVVSLDWEALSYGQGVASQTFRVEKDGHIYEGTIRRK